MTLYYPVASAAKKAPQSKRLIRLDSAWLFRLGRFVGTVALGLVMLQAPELGPRHIEVGWLLLLGIAPISALLDYWCPPTHRLIAQMAFDLSAIVLCCAVLPQLWFPGLVLGALIVGGSAPRFALTHKLIFALLPLSFFGAMAILAQQYALSDTWLPLLAACFGTPFCLLYVLREQRRAQELRDRSNLMDGLSRMAGGIGHDFNNLLTAIQGNAELAEQKLDRNHLARPLLQALLKESQKAQLFSAQLLAFSGGVATGRERLDVAAELSAIAGLLESALPRGVRLEIRAESHLPLVSANRAQLQEIAVASILHVADAIYAPTGKVEVTLRKVVRRYGDELVLQLRSSPTQNSQTLPGSALPGSGLSSVRFGLQAAQQIMRDHEGEIDVHGDWREGMVITLRLPGLPDTLSAASRPAVPARVTPRHILLFEGAPEVASVVRDLLLQLGHSVTAVDNEDLFLATLAGDPSIDAAMLDGSVAGQSRLPEQIDTLRPHLPVLLPQTASGRVERWLERNNVNYVAKPYSLSRLSVAMRQLFDTQRN